MKFPINSIYRLPNIGLTIAFQPGNHRFYLSVLQKYHEKDVEVARKDGLILIREMAAEVKNMMDIKMNAVLVSTFLNSAGGN